MRQSRAFTLVEMAMVLIIIGLIVGGSAKIFATLSKNSKVTQTTQKMERLAATIEGFALSYHRLPTLKEYEELALKHQDGWGKRIVYIPEKELMHKNRLCQSNATQLHHQEGDALVRNLAFILLSSGANRNRQTRFSQEDGAVLESAKFGYEADFYRDDVDRKEPFDDIIMERTLFGLKSQIGCESKQLKILSGAVTKSQRGGIYRARFFANQEDVKLFWCFRSDLQLQSRPDIGRCEGSDPLSWKPASSLELYASTVTQKDRGAHRLQLYLRNNLGQETSRTILVDVSE